MIKIGIIGCGTIFPIHIDAINDLTEVEIVMVCDSEEERASEAGRDNNCEWTTDYLDILSSNEIDVVHILTPHYLHVPMALEALKFNKNVVLEKPVGISLRELENLRTAEVKSECSVFVTLQNRFNPTTVKAKKLIESGRLGTFLGSKGSVVWSRKEEYYKDSKWRGKIDLEGGGLLINQAIHTLDLLEYIGGEVISIQGKVNNTTHSYIEVEDQAMITLGYKNGSFGHFYGTNSYAENSNIEMEFVFEKGKLVFKDQELIIVDEKANEVVAEDRHKEGSKSYWGVSHKAIIANIYESIIEGTKPMVTLEYAIKATELVLATYESSLNDSVYLINKGE